MAHNRLRSGERVGGYGPVGAAARGWGRRSSPLGAARAAGEGSEGQSSGGWGPSAAAGGRPRRGLRPGDLQTRLHRGRHRRADRPRVRQAPHCPAQPGPGGSRVTEVGGRRGGGAGGEVSARAGAWSWACPGRGSAAFPGSARGHGSPCARGRRVRRVRWVLGPGARAPRGADPCRPGTPRGTRGRLRGACEGPGRAPGAQGAGAVRACGTRPGRAVARCSWRGPWVPRAAPHPRLRPCREGLGLRPPAAGCPRTRVSPGLAVRAPRNPCRSRRVRLVGG